MEKNHNWKLLKRGYRERKTSGRVNDGWDFGEGNETGERILDFVEPHDLGIVNTVFLKKR